MARQDKRDRKKRQEKQHLKKQALRRRQAPPQSGELDEAQSLIRRGRWSKARDVLEAYERAHPGHLPALRMLCGVYQELRDYANHCRVCRRLLEHDPTDRLLHIMLAAGYLLNARPASAVRAFRRFLDLWPDDPLADDAHKAIAEIGAAATGILQYFPCPADERIELGAMHEEVLDCLESGDNARTVKIGRQLLDRWPNFTPAMNNMSEACFREGRGVAAIAHAQAALQHNPDNVHALANLTRLNLLCGQPDEARQTCARLRSVASEQPDASAKKIETFGYLGDDQAVLDEFAAARRAGNLAGHEVKEALAYHLVAVAHARLGDQDQALDHWRKALKILPNFKLARENLADAKLPPAERQGPWPFNVRDWIPGKTLDQAIAALDRPNSRKDDKSAERALRRFVDDHPEIASLVPALLDRGDEVGRGLAKHLALTVKTPEMLAALRDFCLSQRGPDELRVDSCNALCRAGFLTADRHRLWMQGEWHEIELMGFEISSEPVGASHSDRVNDWMCDGLEAIGRNDGVAAEKLFRLCLAAEGDTPTVLNNLAGAYATQGRHEESLQLVRQIHERWPEYFFGRVAMASIAARGGDYEQAHAILAPLRRRRKLHTTEFTALAAAYIQLMLAEKKPEGVQPWLQMWKKVAPDDPNLARFEAASSGRGMFKSLLGRFSGLR